MSRAKGDRAESAACEYLSALGFEVIERNFFARSGEIDIIALKNNTLHFIEVKSGKGFEPIYNISAKKLERLESAIGLYLTTHNITQSYCLDALIIKEQDFTLSFELIENITMC